MREAMREAMRRSSLKNWLLTIISTLFTVAGIAVSIARRDPGGLAPAAFFGACAAVGVWSLRRDRQIRAHASALAIEIPEHVPLRRRGREVAGLGGVLVVAGAATIWMPGRTDPWLVALEIGIAALGLGILVALALGKLKGPYLQFEPEGLRLGLRRYTCLVEWSNIVRVAPGELAGHDLLLIDIRDAGRLLATASPATAAPKLAKLIATTRSWYGADVVLIAVLFGTDVAALAQAMRRYWAAPDGTRVAGGPTSDPAKLPPR